MDFGMERKINRGNLSAVSQDIASVSSSGKKSAGKKNAAVSDFDNEAEKGNEPENIAGTRFVETEGNEVSDGTSIFSVADKKSIIEGNSPLSESPGEIQENTEGMVQSSELLKMKKQILQKRLWLGINPVEKSNDFGEMLRNMDAFYNNLKKRKSVKPSTGWIPGGMGRKNSVSTFAGKSAHTANMSDATPAKNSGDDVKPSDEKPKSDKPTDAPAEKPKPEQKPDSTPKDPDASKKVDEHKKALDDAARDSRKEEADRLKQEKQTNRDREEKQKMEKVAGLTHEIKEINSGINKLESQVRDMESSLEELEAENRNNPDFDPEPYRDEIEDKKIQIEMMLMKKELKKMEIESLMGKPQSDDSYEENAIDTTMAKGELHRERFDDVQYKSKETMKSNLEFIEDYKGDKNGADVVSRYAVDGKKTGASEKSSELQSLIKSKFDAKLDPVDMKSQ